MPQDHTLYRQLTDFEGDWMNKRVSGTQLPGIQAVSVPCRHAQLFSPQLHDRSPSFLVLGEHAAGHQAGKDLIEHFPGGCFFAA